MGFWGNNDSGEDNYDDVEYIIGHDEEYKGSSNQKSPFLEAEVSEKDKEARKNRIEDGFDYSYFYEFDPDTYDYDVYDNRVVYDRTNLSNYDYTDFLVDDSSVLRLTKTKKEREILENLNELILDGYYIPYNLDFDLMYLRVENPALFKYISTDPYVKQLIKNSDGEMCNPCEIALKIYNMEYAGTYNEVKYMSEYFKLEGKKVDEVEFVECALLQKLFDAYDIDYVSAGRSADVNEARNLYREYLRNW